MNNENLLQNDQTDVLPDIDPNKNYLEELVGPGKKFATVEDMAKGKYLSDLTVDLYKRQKDQMRDDLLKSNAQNNANVRMEELINQLSEKRLASSEETIAKEVKQPSTDPKEIESLISRKVQELEQERRQKDNLDLVTSKLQEHFGENYRSVVNKQIGTVGLSGEDFTALAKKSPDSIFKLLGIGQNVANAFEAPVRSSQRSDNFSPKGGPKRTWAYYQELYKKDPQLYFDRKISVQMQKDAVELGEAFRDGDYYVKGLHED